MPSDFDDDFDDEPTGTAHTSDGESRPNDAYEATAAEVQQFFERHERIEQTIKDAQEDKKNLMAELKNRGFDKAAFGKVVKVMRLDKTQREKIEETRSIASIYLSALGHGDLEDLL